MRYVGAAAVAVACLIAYPATAAGRKTYTMEEKRNWAVVRDSVALSIYCHDSMFEDRELIARVQKYASARQDGHGVGLDTEMSRAIQLAPRLRQMHEQHAPLQVRKACSQMQGASRSSFRRRFDSALALLLSKSL